MVLELFEEGGKYEGRWGWLDVLKQAEIGDQITIDWADGTFPEGHPVPDTLTFDVDACGNLILTGDDFYFGHAIAGLFGESYTLQYYTTDNGQRVAAAFLIVATDITIGIPAFLAIVSGNPALMKAGEFLELSVVLPVNLLGVKMWDDAKSEVHYLTVDAITDTHEKGK